MSVHILVGDVRERLAELPADHFDCVLTSPPYWGLRSYLDAGHPDKHLEIGCEPTLGEHLEVIVGVMDQVRRVLKPTGVCFINYGDCYATAPNGRSAAATRALGADDRTFKDKPFSTIGPIFGEPCAPACDNVGRSAPDSQDHGSPFQSLGDARKDSPSIRIPDNDFRRALEQSLGPLSQIQAHMASLLDRLPSGDFGFLTAPVQSSVATLDQAHAASLAVESLLGALESTTPEFLPPHLGGFPLSDMLSACLASLSTFSLCVRRCVDKSAAPNETLRCTADSASLSEELANCIRCSIGYCLLVQSWGEIKPQRAGGPFFTPDPRDEDRRGTRSTLQGPQTLHTPGRIVAGGYLKPKDLCLVPQRLAIALQENGWWVRSLLPWVKRNGMPESINDRPASSIEYVIMLTKSARYAYDAESVRRPASRSTNARVAQDVAAQAGSDRATVGAKTNGPMKAVVRGQTKQDATAAASAAAGGSSGRRMAGFNERWDAAGGQRRQTPKSAEPGSGIKANTSFHAAISDEVLHDRNFRNSDLFFDSLEPPFGLISGADGLPIAIDVCPQGFKEAHFATFPEALALPLLRAGNPARGPVLDPFGGAGTVGLVADRLGMNATLIELNEESAAISQRRITGDAGMFSDVEVAA